MTKLRNLSKILIGLLILLIPFQSVRAEPTSFDTFPAEIVLDGKSFAGYLLSDLEYDRYVRLDVEYNLVLEKYNLLVEYKDTFEEKFDKLKTDISNSFIDIQKLAYKRESWFDRNKSWIFLTGGIIVGTTLTYLVMSGN